jgi:steroid 5-alpha reductase family enzyme
VPMGDCGREVWQGADVPPIRPRVAGRVVAEIVGAAAVALAVALTWGVGERQRAAQHLDGNEVETDGDAVIAFAQLFIGAGLFLALCVLAFLVELLLWARRRHLAQLP